ncbi:hypothetical protein RHGRI_028702 [Rhododendron griersonianum]|uniref:Uncharacterized protein n=1 Tax=Rhododendron griersonianum TaxID=479676 RepID=A0AAV6IJ32_9ERIC|nr:hypothetical protein RHGRI_028702 [Rhododendron griersonianum]
MAFSPCFPPPQLSLKINRSVVVSRLTCSQRFTFALKCTKAEIYGQRVPVRMSKLLGDWSFMVGSRISIRPNVRIFQPYRRSCVVRASWLASSQIASSVLTLGTAAVLPFYTLMVLAPKAELVMFPCHYQEVYGKCYTLYSARTSLSGIAKMFSNEMTLASAWIHLLAVDLFAARQVFHDGLESETETRHSVSLCMLCCPVGIVSHVLTKGLTKRSPSSQIASSVFTLGTAAVLPFYTLMVLAPKAELTKKSMESSIPYIVLGLLYAYLLYLSWTPDTLRLMFASKYWLPELSGIAKMFSNEMTLASAWIHLLAVDLFAARSLSLSLSLSLSRVHVCQHKILQITLPQG